MTSIQWVGLGGIAGGLFIAHFVDVFAGWWKRFRQGGDRVISPHFSPKGGCQDVIVSELNKARREILVQAYSFTCKNIAEALINAVKRGVKVCVLLDRSNEAETHTELGDIRDHGIEIHIDACHAIAHNKVMLIDRKTILTGSFNFTNQAEHENAENLLVLRNHPELAEAYRTNFNHHKDHCHAPGELPKPHIHTRTASSSSTTHRKAA
jgi:phosphatidylserine/phosphatidylglycerophosphate/cardiolipin synthase-like enzyme